MREFGWMSGLFASGRIVDLILALTVLEWFALTAYRRRTGRGPAPAPLAANLLAGVCLLLAVRAALVDAWWGWLALCLAGSLVAHLADLGLRWTPAGSPPRPERG
jgi:hypothetical protein